MNNIIHCFTNTLHDSTMLPLVYTLIGAEVLDFITGLAKAWHNHSLKSRLAKEGLVKKLALFAFVAACGLVDLILPVNTGFAVCKLACTCFVISEAVSIMENAAEVGVPVPAVVRDRLAQINDSMMDEHEEDAHED